MADADNDQKSFDPTEKKIDDARRRGDVATAAEVRHAAMFAAALVVTGGMAGQAVVRAAPMLVALWGGADGIRIEPAGALHFATAIAVACGAAIAPLMATLLASALLGGLLQGRPTLSWSRVKPNWARLNPLSALTRLFGLRALVEFAKTLAKMTAVIAIAIWVLRPKLAGIDRLTGAEPWALGAAATDAVHQIVWAVAVLVAALALFDLVWQRQSFLKRMRMSLQEIRDEHKEQEGDPKIKGKIRQMQMQRARSRMMAAVPKASVVVTNPTHYAVALHYDHGAMKAPVVVAKGVDAVALKIREVATEHRIPLVENRPLARALHASAEIDQPIPAEHYAAVAEVISYVLRLARRR